MSAVAVKVSTIHEQAFDAAYARYRDLWAKKNPRAIQREIDSMHRYMDRHGSAYFWHGKSMTPPGCLGDGDKMCALREALEIARLPGGV